jgi:hypothetical protein
MTQHEFMPPALSPGLLRILLPKAVPAEPTPQSGQPISSVSSSSSAACSRFSRAAPKRHSLFPPTHTAIPKSERATRSRVRLVIVAIVPNALVRARLTTRSVFAPARSALRRNDRANLRSRSICPFARGATVFARVVIMERNDARRVVSWRCDSTGRASGW